MFVMWRRRRELRRWNRGYRSHKRAQPTSEWMDYRPDMPDVLQLHDRGGELERWNVCP